MTSSRDRSRTEAAIVDAAVAQLAEAGFQAFGVNTVARRAGCDKQLIYRYFGGIDGLVDAVGQALALRLTAGLGRIVVPGTYAGLIHNLLLGFLDLLLDDALLRQALAWELAGPSPAAMRLAAARSTVLAQWLQSTRGDLQPPPGRDAPAINALLIGAVQQMVLSWDAAGSFSGLARDAAGEARARAALEQLVAGAYGSAPAR